VREVVASGSAGAAPDDELLAAIGSAARIGRLVEVLVIDATGQVQDRSASAVREERLTVRMGCGTVNELLQRVTRSSRRTVAGYERAARGVHRPVSATSGEALPAEFPALRKAMGDGAVGVDALLAVTGPLTQVPTVAGREAFLAADEELAASARGEGANGEPPACAEDLRVQAQVWGVYLDQDGAEPREARAMRRRGIVFGQPRDDVVPFHGNLLPEVFAQFQTLSDSILNPRTDGPRFAGEDEDGAMERVADTRTRAQKQHDVLATVLTVAAGSGELPTVGGAAPTLVVAVRAEDYESGRGYAQAQGCDEPVPLSVARHTACTGDVQRVVFDPDGRIVALGTTDRIFNRAQRRAITLRDGGCFIPGCHVPARWCEVHHVTEHAAGGATHCDNGVQPVDEQGRRPRDGAREHLLALELRIAREDAALIDPVTTVRAPSGTTTSRRER